MRALPRWAQKLKDRHPDGEMPTRDNPIPAWLEEEVKAVPLWYLIREAATTRSGHPYLVLQEIQRQPAHWAEIVKRYWPRVQEIIDIVRQQGVDRVIQYDGLTRGTGKRDRASVCDSPGVWSLHFCGQYPRFAGHHACFGTGTARRSQAS